MLEAVLEGFALGGVLALMIGPVFFMLINTSLKKGLTPAVYMAFGVMLSDAMFISFAYFGSTYIRNFNLHNFTVGLIAGIILVIFGLVNLVKKPHLSDQSLALPDDSKTFFIDTGKGFMMNTLNPFALIFWMGVAGTVSVKESFSPLHLMVFFSATLATIFATDFLKAFLASRLKKIITYQFLLWMNRITGLALMAFGIRTILKIL